MAPTLEQTRPVYRRMWDSMIIRDDAKSAADAIAKRILSGKAKYIEVEHRTGVPWWFVGLLHSRESNCNFNTYLGNGQRLDRKTTIVPKGRGPFKSFLEGAIDALQLQGFTKETDWSLEAALYRMEAFNGWGYIGKTNSPYIWSGSYHYNDPTGVDGEKNPAGKYVADHKFDPKAVDKQIGCAVILARMAELDASVKAVFDPPPMPASRPAPAPTPTVEKVGAGAGAVIATAGVSSVAAFGWNEQTAIWAAGAVIVAVVVYLLFKAQRD